LHRLYIFRPYKKRERNEYPLGGWWFHVWGKQQLRSRLPSNMRNVCAQRWASIRDWQIIARATFHTRRKCWASRDTNKDRRSINARTGSNMQIGRWHSISFWRRKINAETAAAAVRISDHRSELLFRFFFLNLPFASQRTWAVHLKKGKGIPFT
jgi:hypothetical protein